MSSFPNPNSDYLSAAAAAARPGREQRDDTRRLVSASISFRQPGRKGSMVSLRDVSATGCRFTSYVQPAIGQRIWISLPGLESLAATVRWVTGNDCGCEFDRALYPAVLESVMMRIGQRPS
ncbi:PilZ domain-containing protein [Sphingorhabdus soli]|uniref:PilZ domain-containing protein n=1 Tax=Flavisphingopyxis soli TaxID=2601267 RepID=A0A5C6ULS8_9SPHN|nr:PilZ domain-containing protein [Sphingorhabdus soli]TXC73819.1 PilZ domain-containing protein [Sphingorhabdus soli]